MAVIQPTEWYYPPTLPIDDRWGYYDVVAAHPLTPKDDDEAVRAYWGQKFGSVGFWKLDRPQDGSYAWTKIVHVLRWRGRKATPRIPLTVPAAPVRVRLVEQLVLDLPKRRVALL